jgi:hypothetical protein
MSGSEGSNPGSEGRLEANHFGLDLPDDLLEAATASEVSDELLQEATANELPNDLLEAAEAEHYSELVARQWGTPEGEWWP